MINTIKFNKTIIEALDIPEKRTRFMSETVKELDLMSKNAFHENNGNIAVAYTVWSRKRGAGKQTIYNAKLFIKEEMKLVKRFITLSPLSPIATHFHIKHGVKLININTTSQNFEYDF